MKKAMLLTCSNHVEDGGLNVFGGGDSSTKLLSTRALCGAGALKASADGQRSGRRALWVMKGAKQVLWVVVEGQEEEHKELKGFVLAW